MNMVSKYDLSWRILKALKDLYGNGKTKAKIADHPFIKLLMGPQKRLLRYKMGNHGIIETRSGFNQFYGKELAERMNVYEQFLISNELETDARRNYKESDIETLLFVKDQAEELRSHLTTIEAFGSEFFDSSKHLKDNKSVSKAVLKLLNVDDFPDESPKNHLWRFVVDNPDPRAIILCENKANMKRGWKAKREKFSLWYVGGNNTAILNDIPNNQLNLSIYYSCDWDYHGLRIYSTVKSILEQRGAKVKIIVPPETAKRLPVDSLNHNSKWILNKPLSGLPSNIFNKECISLINDLISSDQWIEEESWDLFETIESTLNTSTNN